MKGQVTIIGGGIVGLATALQLLRRNPGLSLRLLEKEDRLAAHQTGHNSGVIHSGIYYKPGSLKAQNCIRGYQLLVEFCRQEALPFELCGKVIVATDKAELPQLDMIHQRGVQNGLQGLKKLTQSELREHEPHVAGIAAVLVPQAGIVDYTLVAQAYARRIGELGGEILLNQKVTGIMRIGKKLHVQTGDQELKTDLLINCAGLYSDKVARMTGQELDLQIIPFRGEYYEVRPEKQHLINNLVYPVPDPNFPFLGVHFTRMIGGGIEAGPNAVLAFRREGYTKSAIDPREFLETLRWPGFQKVAAKYWRTGMGEYYRSFSKAAFTKALQKLLPEIRQQDLLPGGAGVRAQACDRHGGLVDDFLILESPGVVNVCNAPSPAATSSLSIGLTVAELAEKQLN
ncbi:L-2-hydroxyglutarate oxidase [Cesiribacter andamanensis]|uniref:L-2-hydroxyglutarate oxidase LhgO n=1 Tax=Cesiribacter andamanensis AMV16 TaxID=1279009 RepID=M7NB96_9BACT|nr:L-2-hydroxyglutarate oxidase [Cesiribacter andamanensis]EMR04476.1 L-2-hydroxyglutarate oxidase LhgO [Cesiribacter andamanensis AMV16]